MFKKQIKMKNYFLTALFILCVSILGAQEVISSSGGYSEAQDVQLSWTLGEPVIVTVARESNILTQGFHQTKLTITPIETILKDYNISVFPNPAVEIVKIQLKNFQSACLIAELFAMDGNLLKQIILADENNILNVQEIPNGSYLLKIRTDTEQLQTFKLEKIF